MAVKTDLLVRKNIMQSEAKNWFLVLRFIAFALFLNWRLYAGNIHGKNNNATINPTTYQIGRYEMNKEKYALVQVRYGLGFMAV